MILSYPVYDQLLYVAIAILVLVFPGLAVTLITRRDQRDMVEKLADTIGLSVALVALLGMIFFFLDWRFSGVLVGLIFTSLAAFSFYLLYKRRNELKKKHLFWLIGTGLILLGVIGFRFYQAKSLVFPAWVDSVHHVLITQKILDVGGLPKTLAPEMDVPLYYHYGFHIISALFSWISHLEPVQAVLWFGQVINGLVVLGIYRLSKALWRQTIPAILAALLVGFAFQMPAYYLTWGRYTLLTGLLVMLPAMANAYELVMRGFSKQIAARLILLTAGLVLVHYLALYYFGFFLAGLVLVRAVGWYRENDQDSRKKLLISIIQLTSMVGIGILIASPWLLRMLQAHASQVTVQIVLPKAENLNSYEYILYLLGPTHNYFLMGGAFLGLILVWWQKNNRAFAFWTTLMALLAFPWGFRFGPFRPDHMAIVLFIPASILLSYAWVWLSGLIQRRVHIYAGFALLIIGIFGMLGWGFWQTRNVINSVTILADQADWDAIQWIDKKTPAQARFLTNTTKWQFNTYRGVDGGYWILPLTGRFATALPSLYGYADVEQQTQWINWMERTSVVHACDDGLWSLVRDAHLTHIYIHEGKGSLQPSAMIDCPNIEVVYTQNGVWIYEVLSTD